MDTSHPPPSYTISMPGKDVVRETEGHRLIAMTSQQQAELEQAETPEAVGAHPSTDTPPAMGHPVSGHHVFFWLVLKSMEQQGHHAEAKSRLLPVIPAKQVKPRQLLQHDASSHACAKLVPRC